MNSPSNSSRNSSPNRSAARRSDNNITQGANESYQTFLVRVQHYLGQISLHNGDQNSSSANAGERNGNRTPQNNTILSNVHPSGRESNNHGFYALPDEANLNNIPPEGRSDGGSINANQVVTNITSHQPNNSRTTRSQTFARQLYLNHTLSSSSDERARSRTSSTSLSSLEEESN